MHIILHLFVEYHFSPLAAATSSKQLEQVLNAVMSRSSAVISQQVWEIQTGCILILLYPPPHRSEFSASQNRLSYTTIRALMSTHSIPRVHWSLHPFSFLVRTDAVTLWFHPGPLCRDPAFVFIGILILSLLVKKTPQKLLLFCSIFLPSPALKFLLSPFLLFSYAQPWHSSLYLISSEILQHRLFVKQIPVVHWCVCACVYVYILFCFPNYCFLERSQFFSVFSIAVVLKTRYILTN